MPLINEITPIISIFFLFGLLFWKLVVGFLNFLGLFFQFELMCMIHVPVFWVIYMFCFFYLPFSVLQFLDPLVDRLCLLLEIDLNLFRLPCFALNDFACCFKVGLSLAWSVVLHVGCLLSSVFCFNGFA